jgi:ribosome-binding factor A
MMDASRAGRLADRIAVLVAELLERRIKDPRLGFVTITEAKLTNDLREATVYYTVFGDDPEETARALRSATGIIRSEVGRQLGLRHTPSLEFVPDSVPETAARIDDLVSRARAADEEIRRANENATYAGDPDPYRKPPSESEDD